MLAAVRNGSFYPDLTRSGRVQALGQPVKVEVSDDELVEPGLTSFPSEGSFEAVSYKAIDAASEEDQVAAPADHELSSSDSGSSQDDAVAGFDNSEIAADERACAEAKPRPSWEPGYIFVPKAARRGLLHVGAR